MKNLILLLLIALPGYGYHPGVHPATGSRPDIGEVIPDQKAAWQGNPRQPLGTGTGFPVSVSGRDMLDNNGKPWLGVGDAPWSLVGQLADQEITYYLEDRAARGFRLVMFSAPEWYYADNAPNNIDNVAAFTGIPFQSPLNDPYWLRVDHAVDEAARLGITCLICPAYWGCCNDGVQTVFAEASNPQVYDYGYAVGDRYKNKPNIMWLAGHDLVPAPAMKERYVSLQQGLQDAGDTHLWVPGGWNAGGHYSQGTTDWGKSGIGFDVETNYDYSFQPVLSTRAAWTSHTMPVIHLEGSYENERTGNQNGHTAAWELRYQGWGSFVAGAACHIYGSDPIWHFNHRSTGEGDWMAHLDDRGAKGLAHLAVFLDDPGWPATVPDTGSIFLTDGMDTGRRQAGARFAGSMAVVYMPNERSVTLDLSQLRGDRFEITRMDPTGGKVKVLDERASGPGYRVASQGLNAAGDSDWVLIIRSSYHP